MTTRRCVLQLGACLAANSLLPKAFTAESQPKTLLILGGTGFIGPHLTRGGFEPRLACNAFQSRQAQSRGCCGC